MRTFEVTEAHLKLLDRMYIGYDEWTEFGAPEVDPKRPYGNSDVYGDIAEILDLYPEGDNDGWGNHDFTNDQKAYMLTIHKEMQHVLQILVRTRSVEVGRYQKSGYGIDWKKI